MSPAELAWRATAAVRQRLPTASFLAPEFRDAEWRAQVEQVIARDQEAVVRTAERVAAGELEFWGRRFDVDPRHPAWDRDPFTGQVWSSGAWRGRPHDPKAIWELHRLQHLVPLAGGAVITGRGDWARLVIEQTLDWSAKNPVRRGIAWASGYEAAHRLVTWAFALPLVAEHAAPDELDRLGGVIADHERFVASHPSRFSSANNHRLAELAGLLARAALTPGLPGWVDLWEELEQETTRQTYADGGSREQAAGYFLYVVEILTACLVIARARGRDPGRVEERLQAMLGWLAAVADAEGEPPPVGDDAEDRILRLDYFEPRRAAAIVERATGSVGIEPPEPARSSVLLPESGYAVFRGGHCHVVFDIGELGFGRLAAHGHADALSVLVDVAGRWVLRDTGTGSYVEGREDDRATAFHNTVVVDGASQAKARGPHLWGRRYAVRIEASTFSPDRDYVRASHDGYGDARHTRSVTRLSNLLLVLDRITAARAVAAELVWQPGPGLRDGPAVAADPAATAGSRPGRYSPRYTWTDAAPRLVWTARGDDVVFASAVALDGGTPPAVALTRRGSAVSVDVAGLQVVEDWASSQPQVAAVGGGVSGGGK